MAVLEMEEGGLIQFKENKKWGYMNPHKTL